MSSSDIQLKFQLYSTSEMQSIKRVTLCNEPLFTWVPNQTKCLNKRPDQLPTAGMLNSAPLSNKPFPLLPDFLN